MESGAEKSCQADYSVGRETLHEEYLNYYVLSGLTVEGVGKHRC